MKIKVFHQYYQNYYQNKQKIRKIIEKKLINPKCDVDVLLIETPIKEKNKEQKTKERRYWTDIFIRRPEIANEIRYKIEDKGIRVIPLVIDDFLGWYAQEITCFSTLAKASQIKNFILEKE